LIFDDVIDDSVVNMVEALRDYNFTFQNKLKSITLEASNFDCKNLATMLLDILPNFPEVSSVDLNKNHIQSVQPTLDRIINSNPFDLSEIPRSLFRFDLGRNYIMTKMKKGNSKENKALVKFLKKFPTIYNLGGSKKSDYTSDVEYALRINHAGGRHTSGSSEDSKTPALPFSPWPSVLEISYKQSGRIYDATDDDPLLREQQKDATGLYDLVRNRGLTLLLTRRPSPKTKSLKRKHDGLLETITNNNEDQEE
jgi:hypothetical protein